MTTLPRGSGIAGEQPSKAITVVREASIGEMIQVQQGPGSYSMPSMGEKKQRLRSAQALEKRKAKKKNAKRKKRQLVRMGKKVKSLRQENTKVGIQNMITLY
ncbi:MAG: hypothetical protein ACK50N_05940 [Flavobacteriales bacterium]